MAETQLELFKTLKMKKQIEDADLGNKMRQLDRAWADFEDICKIMNLKPILPDVGITTSIRDNLGFDLANALNKYVIFFEGKKYNGSIPEEAFKELRIIDHYVLHIYQQKAYIETLIERENKVRKLIDDVLIAEDIQEKEEQIESIKKDLYENNSTVYVEIAILFLSIFNALIHFVKWI
jgi:hypothetical protein